MARQKRFTKKEWSWIMYDWAKISALVNPHCEIS